MDHRRNEPTQRHNHNQESGFHSSYSEFAFIHTKRTMPYTLLSLTALSVLFIFLFLMYLTRTAHHLFDSTSSADLTHGNKTLDRDVQMHCSVITDILHTPPPHVKQQELITYNSRSYCKIDDSPLCVSENLMTGYPQPSLTSCSVTTASVKNVLQRTVDCSELQQSVFCSHGYFPHPMSPVCPIQQDSPPSRKLVRLNSTAIIIPAYPHLGNIFHFSFVAANLAFLAVTNVRIRKGERQNVAIIFRGKYPWQLGKWQKWTMQAVKQRFSSIGIDVEVHALGQIEVEGRTPEPRKSLGPSYCATRSIIMGPRNTVNLWPFPTGKKIVYIDITNKSISQNHSKPTQQKSNRFSTQSLYPQPNVPVEALAWRVGSFMHANLPTKISNSVLYGDRLAPDQLWTDLPPMVIGYARRNTEADPPPGEPVRNGPIRRLSDADEEWLMSMMRKESEREGFEFRIIKTTVSMPVAQQVSIFHGTGIVVGLHGANLVNSVFMPPFSPLIEISPINLPCYNGGMNSGLLAWRIITNRPATPEESSCPPNHQRCKTGFLERRVLLDEDIVRARVQYALKEAIEHVKFMRHRFRKYGAVPVVLDKEVSTYFIKWKKHIAG